MPVPTRISLLIKYTIPWKGGTVQVSNRFHLTTAGGAQTPANTAAWQALADDLVLHFKACIIDGATIDEVVCYAAGSNVAVHNFPYSTAGTVTPDTNAQRLPAFCAYLLKWTTDQRTSKNHPIYLFNYIHGLYEYRGTPDSVQQRGAIDTFGSRMASSGAGITDGTHTYFKSGPFGAAAQSNVYTQWVHEHQLFA